MNMVGISLATFGAFFIIGCKSVPEEPVQCTEQEIPPGMKSLQHASGPQIRVWNDRQLNLLRSFALAESPKLWQTVQTLRSEHETRKASLDKLRTELVDFGRDPDDDSDYVSLKAANDRLLESVNEIYAKIEDAYIACKKFQAMPGSKEYRGMMKRAIEDGMQEADSAFRKYYIITGEK